MKQLSIYIHIPFCKKKCLYCDFPSFSGCENIYEDYVNSLVSELGDNASEYTEYEIATIFIGGGTPTVLPPKQLGRILDMVLSKYNVRNDAEITIEANPGTVNAQIFKELKSMYVNRLSFGVQAWQNSLLTSLGRIHDNETFVRNFNEARDVGFKNISCDLMFSLPNQILSDWEETLEKIMRLNPEHISAYSLIIEDGTPFKEMYEKGMFKATDDVLDREMYYLAKEMLKDKGYNQYEISNFAKQGFESRHNIVYWNTKEYLGFGLGAHSYIHGERFHNTYAMSDYINSKGNRVKLRENIEILSKEEKMEEFMFMGLRMTEGISISEFKKRFNSNVEDVFKDSVDYLIDQKLLYKKDDMLALTDKGIDLSNFVFEKFIIN
ncbi:MAG: radical SAM family heme chaperone HemW [Lachnospiraceae bacterium]|nr:radical SAM family heme chaperone HemW [Lachnospiraceae bacterium]